MTLTLLFPYGSSETDNCFPAGEAIYLRDELVARLLAKGEKNAFPAPAPDGSLDPIWSGSLAGPEAIPRLADYLEKLARRLSP